MSCVKDQEGGGGMGSGKEALLPNPLETGQFIKKYISIDMVPLFALYQSLTLTALI